VCSVSRSVSVHSLNALLPFFHKRVVFPNFSFVLMHSRFAVINTMELSATLQLRVVLCLQHSTFLLDTSVLYHDSGLARLLRFLVREVSEDLIKIVLLFFFACVAFADISDSKSEAVMMGLSCWTPEQQAARASEIAATLASRLRFENPRIRLTALEAFASLPRLVLFKLTADEASNHAEAIARQLDDASPLIRRASFEAIARLLPGVLWQNVQLVIRRIQDTDDKVRQHALEALGSMPSEVIMRHVQLLAQHIGLFVARLLDNHGHVRFFAQRTLGKLPKQLVAAHAGEIASQIESASAGARIATLSVLATLPFETLSLFTDQIIRQLRHPAWGVRLAAMKALRSLAPAELKEHALVLTRMMHDEHHDVRVEARSTLGAMLNALRRGPPSKQPTTDYVINSLHELPRKNKRNSSKKSITGIPAPKRAASGCGW